MAFVRLEIYTTMSLCWEQQCDMLTEQFEAYKLPHVDFDALKVNWWRARSLQQIFNIWLWRWNPDRVCCIIRLVSFEVTGGDVVVEKSGGLKVLWKHAQEIHSRD